MSEIETDSIIPIFTNEDDEKLLERIDEKALIILPVKKTVCFPGVVIPLSLSKESSVKLMKKVYEGDKTLGIITISDEKIEEPGFKDIYQVGTVAKIVKMLVMPDGHTTVILQGQRKIKLVEELEEKPYLKAKVVLVDDVVPVMKKKEIDAMVQTMKDSAGKIMKLNPEIPQEAMLALENIDNLTFLVNFLSSNVDMEVPEKQRLLEEGDVMNKATMLLEHMSKEIQLLEIKHEINTKTHTDIDQQQRDYFLRQQMKVLQDELGGESNDHEIEVMRLRAEKMEWSPAAKKQFVKELKKLSRINPSSPEYPVALNYCEFMLDLPWSKESKDNLDLHKAQKILDKDHSGLDKVKHRVMEYLAVLKLKKSLKGPILCLYGPPGVGKTSLGKSIAKALGREYIRMSLGGLHDEAEIRGHRKTYIGAMPGRILQNIKKSGTSNPVFILDELDKIGTDFRGDPASAFLEVLDPEQNDSFMDNYLEVEYDLSNVLFIATANSLDTIHPALRDRMEIIEINGYTIEEKIEICKKHLFPKQRKEHGLTSKDISMDTSAFRYIVEGYTRESGVRNLERKIEGVVRNVALSVAKEESYEKKVKKDRIEKALGTPVFDKELYQDNRYAGVVTGLAWTPVGGDILFIEASVSRGKGKLILSGQLGDVMKESAATALSYLRANCDTYGIDYRVFDYYDLHIHVPAGAVPKDGPSAGITIMTAIFSVFTQRKVKSKLAMTGEITLRGKVLPVGGIKEKLLAARRAGIMEVILCKKNKKDVDEIDDQYLKDFSIHFVEEVQEVVNMAILDEKVTNAIEFIIPEEPVKE